MGYREYFCSFKDTWSNPPNIFQEIGRPKDNLVEYLDNKRIEHLIEYTIENRQDTNR